MAAVVSDYFRGLLQEQVDEHGLVVWFDPERVYAALVDELDLPGVAVERYVDSFLDLRRRVEPHLSPYEDDAQSVWRERPGNVLVYVPLDHEGIDNALVDLVRLGQSLYPSASGKHNTRLHVVARSALKDVLPPASVDNLVKGAENGELSLAELDRLAEQGAGIAAGRLVLIFNTSTAEDITLDFLSSGEFDNALEEHSAQSNLAALFAKTYDLPAAEPESAADLRHRLSRYLMLTEVVVTLGKSTPAGLKSVAVPSRGEARKAALKMVSSWRDGRALGPSYATAASRVAEELGSAALRDAPFDALRRLHTFRDVDTTIRAAICDALRQSASPPQDIIAEAQARVAGFWSEIDVTHRELWQIVVDAGRLLALSSEIREALKARKLDARALFDAYSTGEQPWCLIDQGQRHLYERRGRYHADIDAAPDAQEIDALVIQARNRHAQVLAELAEAFSAAFAKARFSLPDRLTQAETFSRWVKPALETSKVAYILVDALRYEMARELIDSPITGWEAALEPSAATFPTVTRVGMAALMPGAERGITLAGSGGASRQLSVEIAGQQVNSRAERLKLLGAALPPGWVECNLGDLTPAKQTLRKKLESAPAAFVTSGEIDQVGENVDSNFARQTMIQVLAYIRQACATLASCGFDRVIISADHGYLFGEDFSEGERIDQPGGAVVELHRRVWVGRGGSAAPGVLRMAASDLGLSGDLEFATPESTAIFVSPGGSLDYVHGGLSLQELVVPVLELRRAAATRSAPGGTLRWTIEPGSKVISSRLFMATIGAASSELLPVTPPKVRVDLMVDGRRVTGTAAAAYGHNNDTSEIELRLDDEKANEIQPNTVTFLLDDEDVSGTASIVIIDATTGIELHRLEGIPVSITF